MPSLEIIKFPNPILSRESRPVEVIRREEKELLDDMLETMYLNQGVGLAAPQAGVSRRMVVVDVGSGPIQLINPIVTKKERLDAGEEGCLSLPGIMVSVKRAEKILYKALDRDNSLIEGEAEGLLARAIQHEVDHLDGILIIDYVNPIKRVFLKRRLLKTIS